MRLFDILLDSPYQLSNDLSFLLDDYYSWRAQGEMGVVTMQDHAAMTTIADQLVEDFGHRLMYARQPSFKERITSKPVVNLFVPYVNEADQRHANEQQRFAYLWQHIITDMRGYTVEDEYAAEYTRTWCAHFIEHLVRWGNNAFTKYDPLMRNTFLNAAYDVAIYARDTSKSYGEEIDDAWFTQLTYHIRQPIYRWEEKGVDESIPFIAQLQNPPLVQSLAISSR